ncbi:MAG TPA: DUF881 domain-containing protein [Clostridiaceae bacterium]|nr:DUF881 domain-containing protein [Clostridiaceae bacterium]
MRRKEYNFVLFIAFIILGILVAVQFRSTIYFNKQRAQSMLDAEKVLEQLNREKALETDLRGQIEVALAQKEAIEKTFLEETFDWELNKEWEIIRLKAGLVSVKGEGIQITLDDAPAKVGGDPYRLIIHDQDIRIILNELKNAGAQAISINGERIVTTSEQVCAGPIILINGNRYPVPYVINVIGDADRLYESMMASKRINIMKQDKIRVDIKKVNEITVPGFSGNIQNLISGLEEIKK